MESPANLRDALGLRLPKQEKETPVGGAGSAAYIELSDNSYESDSDDDGDDPPSRGSKRRNLGSGIVIPEGFLAPLPPLNPVPLQTHPTPSTKGSGISMQFWKAGDFDDLPTASSDRDIYCTFSPSPVLFSPSSLPWVLFASSVSNSASAAVVSV